MSILLETDSDLAVAMALGVIVNRKNNMNLGFGLNVNETAQESGYDQYKMNLFESLGAVAKDNWNFNPVMSLLNYSDLYDARKNLNLLMT